MAENLQNQLKEVGSKLENPPASKDDLITLLTQATESLSELDQSPPKALLDSMQPLLNSIVKPQFLKHEDKEVSLLVAICTCEITRITAPEAPYDDDVLKDIFHLFVKTFKELKDTKDPSFEKRVTVLDTVAKYRSFVVMLDLECEDLVNEMFKTFFTVARDEHHETVITSMETIMNVLLEESEEISDDLLLIILSTLGRDKKDINSASRKLAMNVIKESSGILEPEIKKFLLSSMSEENTSSNPQIDYHEVIYDIYRCAPHTLTKIVPHLKRELLTDKVDIRLKAVKLVGDLFCIKESTVPQTFHPIFLEFLRKFTDKDVEIRMSVVEYAKLCLLSDPLRTEAPQLIAALTDRMSDDDESIRKKVVEGISDVTCQDLSSISSETIKFLAEHLEDKSVTVKKYTLERLSDTYRTWCLKKIDGLDYDWIPGRILKSFFDKDFGQDTVENILSTSLFPVELSVKDKVKNWVKLFSKFDKVEVNALEKILEQRQRLQLELKKYLSLRETYKDVDASELQKKTIHCVRFMSQCFVDPLKTEADFQILDQLKDDNILKILTTLVDPTTSSVKSRSLQDELFKIVDEQHRIYELLNTLYIKCSYIIFDKNFVKDLLKEIDQQKSDGNKLLIQSCMNILMILASFSPLLLSGIEEDLVHLLEDYDDVAIKEGVLHVLAKAGEQLGESYSTLDLILERICLEGSRKQAKLAVHALTSITKDDGLKSLSVLYKRLVDVLEKKTNLPSVLQSLGCIAQTAMSVFETQESKIEEFIRKDILSLSHKPGNKAKNSWDNKSELCSLKIFGIKTLVKSYLPVKDAHLRVGIDELLKDLKNILSFGEISKDVESSSVDKAHLKLASAKAIIRLSKHWDKKIPIDLFHFTLRTSEARFPQVRKLFLKKVHQYIKNKSLDLKYVCAFLLDFRSKKPILEEENQNLSDILHNGNSSVYILPYLIHAIAHHPSCPNIDECKDVKAYEPIYRKLYIYFSKLVPVDEDGKPGVGLKGEYINSIISVIRSIKMSKDAVDTNMSKNSYAICDLCLIIMKRLGEKDEDVDESVVSVLLPDVLYLPLKKKEEEKKDENKEDEIEDDKKDEKKEEINEGDEKMEEIIKEDEKIEEINKEEDKKEDEKMEEINKDEKIEEINKKDEKIEEDNKVEDKKDEKMKEDKEDEKKEEINKEDDEKVDKMEEDNKDDKKEEEINKEDEKKEEIEKHDTKKEDKKEEEINKENKMEENEKKGEEINKENKMEENEKKGEEINKEDEKKENEKKENEEKEEEKIEEEINKEEVNTEVTEGRTWLADGTALAHFQSLIIDANGNISSKVNEDDIMKDSETDGNEIPLGKVLKRIKATRKEVKNGPTPVVETENNVDIMGMLREINLDNLGVSNGHGEIKSEEKLKRKGIPEDLTNVPVPKRRRSTSVKGHKRSSFITSGMKSGPAFGNKMDDDDGDSDSEDGGVVHKEEGGITDEEKPKKNVESGSNQKSGNLRKRKRRRVSRLVKCTRDETEFKTKDLIGRRIKVWWPMDKVFYEGMVKSYDHENNKHVVLYDDGDIEVLCLDKERWKLVKNGHKLAERKLMSYSPPPKEGTSKRTKSSDRSKKTKESTDISPSSMVRGKRTPRQNLNQGQKGVSQRSEYLEIRRSKDSDVSIPEIKPTVSSKIDNSDTIEGDENLNKVEKSRSKEIEMKDAESSSNDSMSSHKTEPVSDQKETENDETAPSDKETHKSDSEGNEEESGESESTDVQSPDRKESSTFDEADVAEYTDDEPLGVWKARVGKSVEGK